MFLLALSKKKKGVPKWGWRKLCCEEIHDLCCIQILSGW